MAEAALCIVWGTPVHTRTREGCPEGLQRNVAVLGTSSTRRKNREFRGGRSRANRWRCDRLPLGAGHREADRLGPRYRGVSAAFNRVQLIADHVRVADAFVDEGLAQILVSTRTRSDGRVGLAGRRPRRVIEIGRSVVAASSRSLRSVLSLVNSRSYSLIGDRIPATSCLCLYEYLLRHEVTALRCRARSTWCRVLMMPRMFRPSRSS